MKKEPPYYIDFGTPAGDPKRPAPTPRKTLESTIKRPSRVEPEPPEQRNTRVDPNHKNRDGIIFFGGGRSLEQQRLTFRMQIRELNDVMLKGITQADVDNLDFPRACGAELEAEKLRRWSR